MYFGRDVDALGPRLVQHVGEQPHLELEAQDVHLGDVLLAAFEDDLLDEQPRHRQVDRPDGHQPPGLLAVEAGEARRLLRPVGPQDQVEERRFLLLESACAVLPRAGWGSRRCSAGARTCPG